MKSIKTIQASQTPSDIPVDVVQALLNQGDNNANDHIAKWVYTFVGAGVDIGLTDAQMADMLTPEKIKAVADIARKSSVKNVTQVRLPVRGIDWATADLTAQIDKSVSAHVLPSEINPFNLR